MVRTLGRAVLQTVRRGIGTSRLSDQLAEVARSLDGLTGQLLLPDGNSYQTVMNSPPAKGTPCGEVFNFGDLFLLLDRASLIDRTMIKQGDWEPEQRQMLFSLAQKTPAANKLFLDIGSYFGLYSLCAMRSGLFTEVHAFEADRQNYAQLLANLFLNGAAESITAHNIFVTAESEMVETTKSSAMPDNRGGVGRYGVKDNQQIGQGRSIDDLLQVTGRSIVAKIDAEDGEFNVLRGMRRTIGDNNIVLQVECSDLARLRPLADDLGLTYITSLHDHYFERVIP